MIQVHGLFREDIYPILRKMLLHAPQVDVGEWHAQSTEANPLLVTKELLDVRMIYPMPTRVNVLQEEVEPNLPWAEEHFLERVSGSPLNPPPSHVNWPWNHAQHQDESEKFSHTYPERFWPKMANVGETRPNGRQVFVPHNGIRYEYGDLDDLVNLMVKNPHTRQAYLPVWFPEDTGAAHGERVPCTLGYHFLVRNNELSMRYFLRSCDFVRHFADDVYLAARLAHWVREQLRLRAGYQFNLGCLILNISSLHIMVGDVKKLEKEA